MSVSRRFVRIRSIIGWLILLAGLSHSLYYLIGFSRGWEHDIWNYFQVSAGLVMALVGAWIIAWRRKSFTIRQLAVFRLLLLVAVLGLVFCMTLVGLIWKDGRTGTMVKSDYLLILGARVYGDHVSLSLRDRLDKGLDYLQAFPDAKAIVSGGQGPGEHLSEAEAMKKYLMERGVASDKIVIEDQSTDTSENMRFSRKKLEELGVDASKASITLVTNDFHMLRSKMLAKRAGLQVSALPARTPEYTIPKAYTRELAALLKSFLLDR